MIAMLNSFVLRIGKTLAWIALALMELVKHLPLFFRYLMNNALPWPDETARLLMLWMTGLIASAGLDRFRVASLFKYALAKPYGHIGDDLNFSGLELDQ